MIHVTNLLNQAIARVLLKLADDETRLVVLTNEERASLTVSVAAAEQGEFATDEEVRAIWAKHCFRVP